MVKYNRTSPYADTSIINDSYLDRLSIRPIPAQSNDILYTIEPQYNHRPDLLAFDLYNSAKLWWVFAQRNMDVLQDPVFDFEPGTKIYIPQEPQLKQLLGL